MQFHCQWTDVYTDITVVMLSATNLLLTQYIEYISYGFILPVIGLCSRDLSIIGCWLAHASQHDASCTHG
jgi:hypothetical protein